MNRRSLIKTAAASAAVATLPTTLLAQHSRAVNLTATKIDWSADGGLTWNPSEAPPPGTAILFRATVLNDGPMTAPSGRPLEIDFMVDGEVVATSNYHTKGLAAGAAVVLEANTGPMNDRLWHDGRPGTHFVQARVDPRDYFRAEGDETDNSVAEEVELAFTITNALGVMGAVIGGMVGGPAGAVGGAFAGGFIGGFGSVWNGTLTSDSMIGWSTESGGGNGGYFPRQASAVVVDWGAPSIAVLNDTIRRFGRTSVVALPTKHWKAMNPDIWGDPGAIHDMKGVRKVVLAYAWLHREQMQGTGNGDELKDLRLYGDGFFDQNGAPTPNGGRATDLGCGTNAFYSPMCTAAGISASAYRAKMEHACVVSGFQRCTNPGWRSGQIAMNHASVLNVPVSLRPSPTNGTESRRHGLRALISYVDGVVQLMPAVGFGRWHDFIVGRAKARGAQVQSTSGAWWVILREFIKFGRNRLAMKPGVVQGMRNEGWAESTLHFVDIFILDFFSAQGMENQIMSEFCEVLLDHILAGEGGPERPVDAGVYFITRPTAPNLRDRYEEVLELYQAWKEGRVTQGVFVSKIDTVSWR